MDTKIVAIAPDDGWAFFVREDKAFIIRPPYHASDRIEISGEDVDRALALHGFEECDHSFDSLVDAIRFLEDKYVKAMKDKGIEPPSSESLRELLQYASDDTLLGYLEKAEKGLISAGKFDIAASLVLAIMPLEQSWNNPEIFSKAISILKECCEKKAAAKKNGGILG